MTATHIIILFLISIIIFAYLFATSKSPTDNEEAENPLQKSSDIGDNKINSAPIAISDVTLGTILIALESIYIIHTSKSIDTIKGRFILIKGIVERLSINMHNPRYMNDVQEVLDKYKEMYYDRIVEDYQIELLLNPDIFDLTDFYGKSLIKALQSNFEQQINQLSSLKRMDAKRNRLLKLKELTTDVKNEVFSVCRGANSLKEFTLELENFELILSKLNIDYIK